MRRKAASTPGPEGSAIRVGDIGDQVNSQALISGLRGAYATLFADKAAMWVVDLPVLEIDYKSVAHGRRHRTETCVGQQVVEMIPKSDGRRGSGRF